MPKYVSNLARCYQEIDNIEESLSFYGDAIAHCSPDTLEYSKIKLQRGILYYKKEDYQSAYKDFTDVLEGKPDKSPLFDLYLERGKTQRKLGNLDGSIADISKCLELQKYNSKPKIMASAYNELGLSLFMKKMIEESIERFSKAIEFDSENAGFFNNRGQAQAALRRTNLAFQDFNKALTLAPGDPTVLHNRGLAFMTEKKYEEAHVDFDEAIAKRPEEASYRFSKGRCLYLEQKYEPAEACFKECLLLKPENTETLYELGLTLDHLKKYDQGMDCFTQLIGLCPTHSDAYQARGIINQKLGNHRFALDDFKVALEGDSTNPLITFLQGRSLLELGSFQEAVECFTKAMEFNYSDIEIYKCFARAFEQLGNLDKALYYLNYGLKKEPGNEDFLLERSNLHVKMSSFSAALDDLQKILNVQSENPYISYKLGKAYYQNKEYQKTLNAMSKALEKGELVLVHQPEAYYIMGLSHANLEDFAQARDCFTRAIELSPDRAVYYHERAKCHLLTDEFSKAIEDFNRTLEKQPVNANAYFGRGFAHKNTLEFRKAVS